jgi:hypothetical protein
MNILSFCLGDGYLREKIVASAGVLISIGGQVTYDFIDGFMRYVGWSVGVAAGITAIVLNISGKKKKVLENKKLQMEIDKLKREEKIDELILKNDKEE